MVNAEVIHTDSRSNDGRPTPQDQGGSPRRGREEGLEACLLRDREATLRWADESPLRLIAAALVDRRRKSRTRDLREQLTAEVITPDRWDEWWKPVQNAVKKSSQLFDYKSKGGEIRLKVRRPSEIEAVPLSELPLPQKKAKAAKPRVDASTNKKEWYAWILGSDSFVSPSQPMPSDLLPLLESLPGKHTANAIDALLAGIERRVLKADRRPVKATRRKWLAPLATILGRWTELGEAAPPLSMDALSKIATTAASNGDLSGHDEYDSVVAWMAEYTSKSGTNVGNISNALLSTERETETVIDGLLNEMCYRLDSPAILDLWRELVSTNLSTTNRQSAHRWLKLLKPAERANVIATLFRTVQNASSIEVLASILQVEWRFADVYQQHYLFDAVILGWVLHRQVRSDAEKMLNTVAAATGQDGEQGVDSRMSDWSSIVETASRDRIERIREDFAQTIYDRDAQLKEIKGELERTKKYVRFLQGENRQTRRAAKLEITRDAITVLGITLQTLATSSIPKSQELSDIEARITLALSTLGVKPFGEIGKTVAFDPSLHEARQPPTAGTPVRIIAPGLKYSRRDDTPLNLIRIQVQVEE